MILTKIGLENYRAFPTAEVSFPLTGASLLIGPNNAGKTAALSAIDAVVNLSAEPGWHRKATDKAVLQMTFHVSNAEREQIIRSIASLAKISVWMDSTAVTNVRWTFEILEPRNNLRFKEVATNKAGGEMLPVVLKQDLSSNSYSFADMPGWFNGNNPSASFSTQQQTSIGAPDDEGALFSGNVHYSHPFVDLLSKWRDSVYHFRALRTGTSRQRSLAATKKLATSGENLAEALLWLKTNSDDDWQTVQTIIQALVPEVGMMQVPAEGGQVEVTFTDQAGVRRNLKELGTGVEQLLLTAYVGIVDKGASLIILEEPETNLHADAQRVLLQHLREWSQQRQIIMATHSTVFMDRAATGISVSLIDRHGGASSVRAVDTHVSTVLESLGVRLSDVLSSEAILLVEGTSDRDIYEKWFGNKLHDQNVTIVPTRGGDRAWDTDSFLDWMEITNALTPKILFIRDRDELDRDAIAKLERGSVRVLRRRELENYLIEDKNVVAETLQDRLVAANFDSGKWTAEVVGASIRNAADATKLIVVLKRMAYEFGSTRLLNRKDTERIITEGITVDRILETMRKNTARINDVQAAWLTASQQVEMQWNEQWQELAPGSEILMSVWNTAGLKFDKNRDGQLIAAKLKPPQEIVAIIEEFLTTIK